MTRLGRALTLAVAAEKMRPVGRIAKDPEYALSSSSEDEHARLVRQAEWYAPYTRRLFARAGIGTGMRVLDVGCGPGDVSFIVSELVGPEGSAVGVDRDEATVQTARVRARERGVANVEFVVGDFREVELSGPFDALVGRLVLMYQADPAAAVAAAARHVRPGGVVAFAEMCIHGPASPGRATVGWPPTSAWDQLSAWIYDMHAALGTQPDMGYRLPATFAQAGLIPDGELDGELVVGVGDEAVSRTVDLITSMLPAILTTGAATEAQVDIDTLAERLRADTGSVGPVAVWPPVVGACARTPA
jgi:SAM-dependent methyltransferase